MTLPAGHQVTASELTALVNPTRLGVTARRVANQSVNSGAVTAISFDAVVSDNTPSFITVTSGTFTIPAASAGLYDITFQVAGATSGTRFLAIIAVTSSTFTYPAEFRNESTGTEVNVMISLTGIDLAVADSFQCKAFHNTGSAVNLTGYMSCYRRAAA